MPGSYKIVICPFCGRVQLTQAEKTFRCINCGRSRAFSTGLRIVKEFRNFREAHAFISEYKRLQGFS